MSACIYGLIDPRNEEIRYVGKSVNPQSRFLSHCREADNLSFTGPKAVWIRELKTEGMTPELVLLQDITDVEGRGWEEIEQYWIDLCNKSGHRLTNTARGGTGGFPPKKRPEPPTPRWWHPELGFYVPQSLGLELTVKTKDGDA